MNPTLKLPLDANGILQIDNSFLDTLQHCPREIQYQNLQRRSLGKSTAALNFGSAGHLALDCHYMGGTPQQQCDVLMEYFHSLTANDPTEAAPSDDWRNLNWAIEVFVNQYNKRYAAEPFNVLLDPNGTPIVERAFSIPFALWCPVTHQLIRWEPDITVHHEDALVPVHYCGRIDLPTEWDGHLIIIDHKTTSRMGDATIDTYRVSAQMTGYAWAWRILTGTQPIGFCVNAIRTSEMPSKPKNGISAWWEESFVRHKEYLSEYNYNEWEKNTFALMETFFWHFSRGEFPLHRHGCIGKFGKCQFYDVDYSPPDQRQELLASDAFHDYTWTPLGD